MGTEEIKREVFICKCNSPEHQALFWYDTEDDELFLEPHLSTNKNFVQRLWHGLKYAFGCKSKYGAWDSMIFKEEDLKKLKTHLNKHAK